MSIPGSANALLLASTAAAAGGYQIERSLRFNSSDSGFCSRTPAVAGNRRTFTFSMWLKRSTLGVNYQSVFGAGASGGNGDLISFGNDNTLRFWVNGGTDGNIVTTQVFRDVSAWYHILYAVDTTQATSSNRIKLYVNGTQVTAVTATYPTQNYDFGSLNTATAHEIGRGYSAQLDGYLADIHFIDGQALTPSSFTEVSATTGQLIPKAYTGSYGTNGFRLAFDSYATTSALGTDTSGNGNTWTVNNISASTGGPTSVAAASGALPIYNTTDTYGTTKGTGTRTDSNSSSIVLAIPMDGANNGTTFTDESATIKGSGSAKSITVNGNAKTVTSVSKFYGSSGAYDGTGDYLSLASSADFQLWNSTAWTVECFIYINSLASTFYFFGVGNRASTTTRCILSVNTSGNIEINWDGTSADTTVTFTTGLAAGRWYHIAAASNGTALKIYVDGIAASQTATLGTSTQANAPVSIAVPGLAANPATYNGLNGYLQDFRIYKGVAKYTSNFNPPSSTQNATIAAGNDSLVDTPTSFGTDTGVGGEVRGNYATFNPLANKLQNVGTTVTLSNGNLDIVGAASNSSSCAGTFGVSSGKWYFEYTVVAQAETNDTFGFGIRRDLFTGTYDNWEPYFRGTRLRGGDNGFYVAESGGDFSTLTSNGTVVGIAFDIDTNYCAVYVNGTIRKSSSSAGLSGYTWFPYVAGDGGGAVTVNFGQRAFAYQTPGTNRPAATFLALCDTNLGAPVVAKPNTLMDVALYTGNGGTQTISGLAFSPDLVWIKARSTSSYNHFLFDVIRGVNNELNSNTTDFEYTRPAPGSLTAFNSDGFALNTAIGVNAGSTTYVGWAWDAGTSTVSNTQGSITSQVRANVSAGFSVVTYTGVTGNQSFGHGLGVNPKLIMIKNRSNSANWFVMVDIGTTYYKYGHLNTTDAFADATAQPVTSTTVTLGNNNAWFGANGDNYVAYCFSSVVGYSSFGSYTGNGSADGPFVYTGFRPRWILVKRTDSADDWPLMDTARTPNNPQNLQLWPNFNNAESTITNRAWDALSNGFKLRGDNFATNASGGTYIYYAVAENPFQYARAR